MSVLEAHGVTVRFGGNMAVQDVDLTVGEGELHGLIGPNGAGKTTTFNVITGLLRPTRGRIVLDGIDVTRMPPHKRARLGLGRTFQRLELFGSLSVLENVLVAVEAADRPGAPARNRAEELCEMVGLSDRVSVRADSLSTGNARLVELARTLGTRPKVVLLDEPASGLDAEESAAMAATLDRLAGDGLAILLVEHDVPLVMGLCSRVTVLNYGKILATGTPAEIQANTAVVAAYLGQAPETGVTV